MSDSSWALAPISEMGMNRSNPEYLYAGMPEEFATSGLYVP